LLNGDGTGDNDVTTESTPRIVGLVYVLSAAEISVAVVEAGSWCWRSLGSVGGFLEPAAALRDELADPVKVARRRLPRLDEFVRGWGRALLPAETLRDPPEVLVVVPHGFLHQLPLHLTLTDDGRALAVHAGVTYCSSLALFRRITQRRAATRGPHVAVGGGFDALADGEDRLTALAGEIVSQFPAMPARAAAVPEVPEVVHVGANTNWGALAAQLRDLADASEPPLSRLRAKRLLSDSGVDAVCLVAHGFIDPQRHRDSGLLLASGLDTWRQLRVHGRSMSFPDRPLRDSPTTLPIRRQAEVLTVTELELDGAARGQVVLLLACSAGSSVLLRADEPGSLAEALVRLGSRCVIAPMWDCDERLAAAWAEAFLDAWAVDDQPIALAARSGFRALGDGRDPSDLGPFHVRGDWR
jgi:hypothetical protein